MKFENVSIKNLESAEKYVEKLMQSEKIFQKEYVEEHIFIGLQETIIHMPVRSGIWKYALY